MNTTNPRLLTLSLAIIATLAACKAGDSMVRADDGKVAIW
jgi:hypothetical protein